MSKLLLCVTTVSQHGNRVVCGTQNGVLVQWRWGTWGDRSTRFRGEDPRCLFLTRPCQSVQMHLCLMLRLWVMTRRHLLYRHEAT